MPSKPKKVEERKKKVKKEIRKGKEKPKAEIKGEGKVKETEPAQRTDIDTEMYRDLFKFLEEKVSLECFIDMHDQCFGKTNCQCQCHKK